MLYIERLHLFISSQSFSPCLLPDSIEADKTLLKPVVRVLLPTEPSCFPSPSKAEVHQPSFPIEPSCSRAAVNCPSSQASFRCPLSWVNFHCPSEVSGLSLPIELRYITFYRPLRWAVFHPFSIKRAPSALVHWSWAICPCQLKLRHLPLPIGAEPSTIAYQGWVVCLRPLS